MKIEEMTWHSFEFVRYDGITTLAQRKARQS